MPKLERVVLINSAGFDYLEFPVGGHSQVIGINGHGKSTLLRTILFFYLGTNDKAPYALHETKSDFVSHYLGDTPSYLVYEVSRGNGQPSFHIAATRPAGRIQFYFVDAPFSKAYYQDRNIIQSVEGVQSRLREAKCHFDIIHSYEEFNRRVYGIASSPYSVFKPAPKSSGLVGVLPRIISGIFTVSQLEADKLKVALTCGVKEDSLSTELDLLLLKSQLEKFSRVNRAVKTYLRYEDDALRLVDVAEDFETAKADRVRAIEDLVRMAKCMPATAQELQAASQIESLDQANRARTTEIAQIENRIVTLQSQFQTQQNQLTEKLKVRDEDLKGQEKQLRKDEIQTETQFQSRKELLEEDFAGRRTKLANERDGCLAAIASEQSQAAEERRLEETRIEATFQKALAEMGVNPSVIAEVKTRIDSTQQQIQRIEGYSNEVVEYRRLKTEFIDPLDSLQAQMRTNKEALGSENAQLGQLKDRHNEAISKLDARQTELQAQAQELEKDEAEVRRFRNDTRFLPEWGFFEREELAPAPFYRAGAAREFADAASTSHQNRERIGSIGDKSARAFLNRFHPETLDKKVLGFSPINEHFDWYIFVGAELRPFVNGRGILGMKQIQTQEFGEIIKKIRNKNADFAHGITDVRRTADLVQDHIAKNNFVDAIDSVELKVERVDNTLTGILTEIEGFADLQFSGDGDMFMTKASRDQIDKAIDTFERLVKEVDNSRDKRLRLTDYFEFLIRVHENGRDMKWRKSLDHIGSTGTDYLVKMLIYLSLIEVYRERTIDPKMDSAVHCILDETGVLAPVYVRSVLNYAKSKGIILITAGHSQQTVGFENWVRVKKRGHRFGGGPVLRKVLVCD